MITIAIIGIMAAIAIPSYSNYTRKSYFSEVVLATAPFKIGVVSCATALATVTGCTSGTNGVPLDRTVALGGVASVTTLDGVITATPVAQNGLLATDTYILTPTLDAATGIITWVPSGGGVTNGYTQ